MGKGRVEEWRREEDRVEVGMVGGWRGGRLYHCIRPGLLYGLPPANVGVADLQVEGVGDVGGRF